MAVGVAERARFDMMPAAGDRAEQRSFQGDVDVMRISTLIVTAVGVSWAMLVGCQSKQARQVQLEPEDVLAVAPMDAQQMDSAWEYVSGKYDANGDGQVVEAEYDRDSGRFDRLDRNSDGVITAADYARGGGGRGGMGGMRTQQLIAQYFQIDEDNDELALEELEQAIVSYDANNDGYLERDEFESQAEARRIVPSEQMERMMRMALQGMDPWDALIEGTDSDGDGHVTGSELVAFFKERDDGDGVWSLNRGRGGRGGGARGGGARGGAGSRAMSGAPEGEMAPDFTLAPPHGSEPVSLSSFRGNLPVALIFGSYT